MRQVVLEEMLSSTSPSISDVVFHYQFLNQPFELLGKGWLPAEVTIAAAHLTATGFHYLLLD